MRLPAILVMALLYGTVGNAAPCQAGSTVDTSTQAGKEWELGRRIPPDLEKKDGGIDDPQMLGYLQQLTDSLSNSAALDSLRVRVTRSTGQYAAVSPKRVLYISAGLLRSIDDEAELSGLIAHKLAHLVLVQQGAASDSSCALDPPPSSSWPQDMRDRERQSTALAVSYLKRAGYDPTSLLSLLSKFSYEHPGWARAIASEDLLKLRVRLENDAIPPAGYRLDSSAFVQVHAMAATMLGRRRGRSTNPSLKADSRD
jgi:predicted Zn-dependent protease